LSVSSIFLTEKKLKEICSHPTILEFRKTTTKVGEGKPPQKEVGAAEIFSVKSKVFFIYYYFCCTKHKKYKNTKNIFPSLLFLAISKPPNHSYC
jgi:hypothetical protein